MWSLANLTTFAGTSLLLVFLWQFFRWKHYKRYPFFAAYVIPMSIHSLGGLGLYVSGKLTEYNYVFWVSTTVVTCLRSCAAWEAVRTLFPSSSAFSREVRLLSLVLLAGAGLLFVALGPQGSIFLDLERKVSLTTSAWIAVVLVLGVYFARPLTRSAWSMCLGIGLLAAVSIINHSMLEIVAQFWNRWSLIRQAVFAVAVGVWAWGFCQPAGATLAGSAPDRQIEPWRAHWGRLRDALRLPGRR